MTDDAGPGFDELMEQVQKELAASRNRLSEKQNQEVEKIVSFNKAVAAMQAKAELDGLTTREAIKKLLAAGEATRGLNKKLARLLKGAS